VWVCFKRSEKFLEIPIGGFTKNTNQRRGRGVARLDFRRRSVSVLPREETEEFGGRSAGSFLEQRLVIEPRGAAGPIIQIRWFFSIALRIPTAHYFRDISAHMSACAYKTWEISLITKLDSEINAPFLLNEHGDPHFLFHNFNENNILNNWEKN